jgi:hypothetical protein
MLLIFDSELLELGCNHIIIDLNFAQLVSEITDITFEL